MTAPRGTLLLRRSFLAITLGALGIGGAAIVVAIVASDFGEEGPGVSIIFTTTIWLLAGCLGLAGVLVTQQGRLVTLIRSALALLVAASVWWTVVVWTPPLHGHELANRIGVSLTVVAVLPLLASQLFLVATPGGMLQALRWAVAGSMAALAITSLVLTWTRFWYRFDDEVAAILLLWSLVTLGGLVAVPTLARGAARRDPGGASIAGRARLELACPRCGAELTLAPGLARCPRCRLRMVIEVEEPRCPCGYLLFRLETDRCPECGRPVEAAASGPA